MVRFSRLSVVAFCVVTGTASLLASASVPLALQTSATESAKTWLDKRQAMEDYLRVAEVIKMEDIGLGVTKTATRVPRPRRSVRPYGVQNDQTRLPPGFLGEL